MAAHGRPHDHRCRFYGYGAAQGTVTKLVPTHNYGSRHRYLQITLQIKDNMTCFANPCGIPGLGSDQHRLRLVVMGDSFVGKSAIIKRFLFGRFVGDESSIHVCVTISKFVLLLDSPRSTQRRWKIFSVVISASPVQTTPLRWTFSTLRGRASSRQCGGEYGGNFRILPPERCVTQACLLDVTFPNPSLTLHVPPLPLVS